MTNKILKIEVSREADVFLVTDTQNGVTQVGQPYHEGNGDEGLVQLVLERADRFEHMFRFGSYEDYKEAANDWVTIYEVEA